MTWGHPEGSGSLGVPVACGQDVRGINPRSALSPAPLIAGGRCKEGRQLGSQGRLPGQDHRTRPTRSRQSCRTGVWGCPGAQGMQGKEGGGAGKESEQPARLADREPVG